MVQDYIAYARKQGVPVGPGRGSVCGSLAAFALRITEVNPFYLNLHFERFLNQERVSLPDIDVDFGQDGSNAVIKYITKKYGKDHVTQISSFGHMGACGAIYNIGQVLGIPFSKCDRFAKLVPFDHNTTLKIALEQGPKIRAAIKNNHRMAEVMELAAHLEGCVRHISKHAAAVVISQQPLTEYLPLFNTSSGDTLTQFEFREVEKLGLGKFDLLGLPTLTTINNTVEKIHRCPVKSAVKKSDNFTINGIPLDDAATYSLLSHGDTKGVFQFGSASMRKIAMQAKPQCLEDLIAIVALFRPGPLQSGIMDDYIKRKSGKTKTIYELPILKAILEETCGVIVYQEQLMQIAADVAGYSLEKADVVRRKLGTRESATISSERDLFIMSASVRGIKKIPAGSIFDKMVYYAEHSCLKAHVAPYALISYQTAYLKANYRKEYMAALKQC